MVQIVGLDCVRCNVRIFSFLDAEFCPSCGNPCHTTCKILPLATVPGPGTCVACGGDPATAIARKVQRERQEQLKRQEQQARKSELPHRGGTTTQPEQKKTWWGKGREKRREIESAEKLYAPEIKSLHRHMFVWWITQFSLLGLLGMVGAVMYLIQTESDRWKWTAMFELMLTVAGLTALTMFYVRDRWLRLHQNEIPPGKLPDRAAPFFGSLLSALLSLIIFAIGISYMFIGSLLFNLCKS